MRSKILFMIFCLILSTLSMSKSSKSDDYFECGRYQFSGKLHISTSRNLSLIVLPDTNGQYQFNLGKNRDLKLWGYNHTFVTLELNVIQPGIGNKAKATMVKFTKMATTKQVYKNPVQKLASNKCKLF